MVVADLTDANANVYYELAIRHLLKKPVVHLITEGQQPPFDVAPMRYVAYNLTDLDSVERAKKELRQQAEALEGGDVTLTVIQFAAMAEKLASPRDQEQDPFAVYALGIQSALSNLQSDLRQVATQVSFLSTVLSDERAPYGITFNQPQLGTRYAVPQFIFGTPVSGKTATFRNFIVHDPEAFRPLEKTSPAEPAAPEPTASPPDSAQKDKE